MNANKKAVYLTGFVAIIILVILAIQTHVNKEQIVQRDITINDGGLLVASSSVEATKPGLSADISSTTVSNESQYAISKNSGGIYVLTKEITISDSSYSVTNIPGYDLLSFSGLDNDHGSPNLPIYKIEIRLPLDTKIKTVDVSFGSKKYIGKLNLPTENPQVDCMGCKNGPRYSPHPTSGLIPKTQYSYNFKKLDPSSMTLVVTVYPMTYDNSTEDTYVYNGFKVTAEYQTTSQVVVDDSHIQPKNLSTFTAGKDLPVSAYVVNMTSDLANLKILANLSESDVVHKVVSSNSSDQVISGNSSSIISTLLKLPTDPSNGDRISDLGVDYEIDGFISNNNNNVASISIPIRVKPSVYVDITCFNYPKNYSYHSQTITLDDLMTVEVCLKNPTDQKVRTYIDISITDQGGFRVNKRPQGFIDIDPGQTKSYIDRWIPNSDFSTGSYGVEAVVSVDNYTTFQSGLFKYSSVDKSN